MKEPLTLVKIFIINPVSTSIWDELTLKHLNKLAFLETEIEITHLDKGPRSIECELDVVEAAPHVIEKAMEGERKGADAIIINCFDDPGLNAAKERLSTLVFGIGETSIISSLYFGHNIAIISTGTNSKVRLCKKTGELGVSERLVYASGLDIGVLDLRHDEEKVKNMLLNEARKAVESHTAEVIVLGCGGLIGLSQWLSNEIEVTVIDPTATTFKIAEAMATLGIKHSKKYTYNIPPHKRAEYT
jgi:allantoin racemase